MQREDLTKQMRWSIAEKLAEDRLPIVNLYCEPVYPKKSLYTIFFKRLLDIVISLVAIIITLPINIIIGIITFFDVGRPIFFKQIRIGKDNKPFTIVKFRNMRILYDDKGELLPPEKRVTKFGKFVRRTSLDELLNFWNILKGDMSLIGPRPLVPEYSIRYNKRHIMRLSVRPGLECPPKNKNNHVWTWNEQFENDIWYVEHVSLFTDIFLFFRLICFALDRKSAKARANVTRGTFMGYDLNGKVITLEEVPQNYIDIFDKNKIEEVENEKI